jgi:GntR family transcriptional regulator, transcriptional repressor for pyruvate dehydrogenase complex
MGSSPGHLELLEPADTREVVSGRALLEMAKDVVYAPIVGESLVDLTAKRLITIISLGLVEVGEHLPSENDLAERLGVSGATLREALASLRGAGLLATRRGRGGGTVVVRDVIPPSPEEARRRLAARSFDELRDLGDYRGAIARRAAELAADRATPAEIELLHALVGGMVDSDSLATYRRLDAQLHIGIAGAARSSWLTAGETTVQSELSEFLSLVTSPDARLRLANDQHRQILEAIRERDRRAAGEAAEVHGQSMMTMLIEIRSELAHAEAERTAEHFAGLRPFGSELGALPLELSFDPLGPRRVRDEDRQASERAPRRR